MVAVKLNGLDSILADYRTYTDNEVATMADLVTFLDQEPAKRDEFLTQYELSVHIVHNRFVVQEKL